MAVVGLLASSSVPSVWRDDPDTAEGVAFFMVHNVRRGTWTAQDSALTLRRGAFQGEAGLAALCARLPPPHNNPVRFSRRLFYDPETCRVLGLARLVSLISIGACGLFSAGFVLMHFEVIRDQLCARFPCELSLGQLPSLLFLILKYTDEMSEQLECPPVDSTVYTTFLD